MKELGTETGDGAETILNIRKNLSFCFERERKTQLTTQSSRRNEHRGQEICGRSWV